MSKLFDKWKNTTNNWIIIILIISLVIITLLANFLLINLIYYIFIFVMEIFFSTTIPLSEHYVFGAWLISILIDLIFCGTLFATKDILW